jgi:L-ascorbate metabolism protein UlaG (beta-lactamase superfamily)
MNIKKRIGIGLAILFSLLVGSCQESTAAEPHPDISVGLEITFLSNTGFLIESGDAKILIDALYMASWPGVNLPDNLVQQIIDGEPPFDDIDLVLVTHEHSDHFSAELTSGFLENNPDTILVSNQAVVDELFAENNSLEERSIAVQLSEDGSAQFNAADIDLEIFHISHGVPGLLNLGFLIDLPGGTVFHSGDMSADDVSVLDLQTYGLPEKRLDLALLPYYLFLDEAWGEHLSEGINARYLIPMHYSPDLPPEDIIDLYPEAVIFHGSLESWELPLEPN